MTLVIVLRAAVLAAEQICNMVVISGYKKKFRRLRSVRSRAATTSRCINRMDCTSASVRSFFEDKVTMSHAQGLLLLDIIIKCKVSDYSISIGIKLHRSRDARVTLQARRLASARRRRSGVKDEYHSML